VKDRNKSDIYDAASITASFILTHVAKEVGLRSVLPLAHFMCMRPNESLVSSNFCDKKIGFSDVCVCFPRLETYHSWCKTRRRIDFDFKFFCSLEGISVHKWRSEVLHEVPRKPCYSGCTPCDDARDTYFPIRWPTRVNTDIFCEFSIQRPRS